VHISEDLRAVSSEPDTTLPPVVHVHLDPLSVSLNDTHPNNNNVNTEETTPIAMGDIHLKFAFERSTQVDKKGTLHLDLRELRNLPHDFLGLYRFVSIYILTLYKA
jgi:hypothetical protein